MTATSDPGGPGDGADSSTDVGPVDCAAPTLQEASAATVNRFDTVFPVPASPGGPIVSGTYVLTEVDVYGDAANIHTMPVVMVIDAWAGSIGETWQSADGGMQSLVGTYTTSSTDLESTESPSCGTTYYVGEPYSASGTTILLYIYQDGNGLLWTYTRQ